MITAAGVADALTPAFVEMVQAGAARPVSGLEVVDPEDLMPVERGDLVVLVGTRRADEVVDAVRHAEAAAGLVLRRTWADLPQVREACAAADLPLLAVADGVPWSSVLGLLRSALDIARTMSHQQGPVAHVYSDLFDMADKISAIVDAPVTVEDATSRVLAYSTGQHDVDEARMSTIIGRRVPREVRGHFRSLGVFRRLARSDEPFFVPAGEGGVKPRYVVPVRAGGEWLGSVWAVVDAPVPQARERELVAAAQVIALYLLRLRTQGELQRQVQLDQIRSLLRGEPTERPDWLPPGPWRVAALTGPTQAGTAEARCELWLALARRHGWRQPLVADLDDRVYAVLGSAGSGPGTWSWLGEVVQKEWPRNSVLGIAAGSPVGTLAKLTESRHQADEVDRLAPAALPRPVASVETSWAALVVARALAGLGQTPLVSPVAALVEADHERAGTDLTTLEAVIDYWGEPQRAARALAVHPNTIRYRMARLAETCPVDLDDPLQRLAVRLEIARIRTGG